MIVSKRKIKLMCVRKGNTNWIHINDRKPDVNQKVFYFFILLGTYRGVYEGDDTFSSEYGFLQGDVTHWAPADDSIEFVPNSPSFTDNELRDDSKTLFGFELNNDQINLYQSTGKI